MVYGPAARNACESIQRDDLPDLEFAIGAGFEPEGGLHLDSLVASEPAPIVDCAASDPAVLIFTSGTAGAPRAAVLSHGSLYSNIRQVLASDSDVQVASDVAFGVLPLFHIFGLNVVLGVTLFVGGAVVLVERFDPVSAVESIEKHSVTVISGPPTMWAALAGLPDIGGESFATVRRAVSGAAKLPTEVANAVEAKYGLHLEEGYGLTEASPVVCSPTGTAAPIGSVGIPLPGIEVRLVDADGTDVLVGDSGELWVRGPNVFSGYWNDEAATARVITEDNWLRTGDVAVVNDDGFLFIVDRAKDLIIVSGFNVYPAEVEDVLGQHPAVEACAVVGVAHPYTGEAVKAYVVARDGISIEEDDVVAFCAERLARYKCPNKIWFVDELPRGLGGKILRRVLR
jgi:long-chain acyl-CoA synthetase